MARQAGRVHQEFWILAPDGETIVLTLKSFLNQSVLNQTGLYQWTWVVYGLGLLLGAAYYRRSGWKLLLLAALFAIPFLGELAVSLWRPIFYDRTLIWTTIPLFVALAAGVAQLRHRILIIAALGLLSTINLFSAGDYFRFSPKEEWDTAAGYVAYFAEAGDLVLFNAAWVQIPFDYYFELYERQYDLRVEKRGVPADMFASGRLEDRMSPAEVPALRALIRGRQRVWLVYSHQWYTDPEGLVPETLASELAVIRQRAFYGGRVQLYGTP